MTLFDTDLRERYQRAVARRLTADRSECPSVEAMEALASGAGSESARLTTLDHVMKCPACQADFELFRAIHGAGKTARPAAASRWYGIAATAVLVAGVSLVFAVTRDSGPVMRGDATASGPELITPLSGIAEGSTVQFVWRPVPNAVRYTVELLEPGGRVRAATTVRDTAWVLPDSVRLSRREEYSWSVRAELPDGRMERSGVANVRVR